MIVDLHAHYAMHLVPGRPVGVWRLLRSSSGRRRLRARARALLTGVASLFLNYRSPWAGPRVRMEYLRQGGVGVALSVVLSAIDEADVSRGTRPRSDYLDAATDQMALVAGHVAEKHAGQAAIARSPQELRAALAGGRLGLVHCVEGGFHLGPDPRAVRQAVEQLAELGVAYITLAHLIWREVATNAPGFEPYVSDDAYRMLFPQPATGLSELGEAAIEAMVAHRVLVDLTHMSRQALDETFALLDRLDPDRRVPVLATHSGYRFGDQEYLLDESTVKRIAERDGLVGLIFAATKLRDGLVRPARHRLRPRRRSARFEESFDVFARHVDRIGEITGSHRHTAIGSDLDGFIKPTLPGFDDMRDMAVLERALHRRYGADDATAICSGNALRVLTASWRGVTPAASAGGP
jgi:microsomal dipeptidase-like Zn-dependent dipeptidase